MTSPNDLTAQAHLAAGMHKLELLRRQFLIYLERQEHEVLRRVEGGAGGSEPDGQSMILTEWLT